MDTPVNLTPTPGQSGTLMSLGFWEEIWMIGELLTWFLTMNLHETFLEELDGYSRSFDTLSRSIRNNNVLRDFDYYETGISISSKTPGRDLKDRWSLDMVPDVKSW